MKRLLTANLIIGVVACWVALTATHSDLQEAAGTSCPACLWNQPALSFFNPSSFFLCDLLSLLCLPSFRSRIMYRTYKMWVQPPPPLWRRCENLRIHPNSQHPWLQWMLICCGVSVVVVLRLVVEGEANRLNKPPSCHADSFLLTLLFISVCSSALCWSVLQRCRFFETWNTDSWGFRCLVEGPDLHHRLLLMSDRTDQSCKHFASELLTFKGIRGSIPRCCDGTISRELTVFQFS